MKPSDQDSKRFDTDFERVTGAYRDAQGEEPPALIDQAVLNRARRAAASDTVRPWNFGWIHAVTTAAVVVLGVALVLQLPEKPALHEAPARPTEMQDAPEPVTESLDSLEADTVHEAKRAGTEENFMNLDVSVPAPSGIPVEAPSPGDSDDSAAAPATREAEPEIEEMALGNRGRQEAVEQRTAQGFNARDFGLSMEAGAEPPEAWLQRIVELHAAGEVEAAAGELEAFRAVYPEFELPPEIKKLFEEGGD